MKKERFIGAALGALTGAILVALQVFSGDATFSDLLKTLFGKHEQSRINHNFWAPQCANKEKNARQFYRTVFETKPNHEYTCAHCGCKFIREEATA